MRSQLGVKLPLSAPKLLCKELLHIKRLLVVEHIVNGPAQFVGENTQGLALVVFSFQFGYIYMAFRCQGINDPVGLTMY